MTIWQAQKLCFIEKIEDVQISNLYKGETHYNYYLRKKNPYREYYFSMLSNNNFWRIMY